MKKYINRPLFSLAILFSLLAGLETPFSAITYSFIFYLISKKSVQLIVPSILVVVGGYAIFCLLGYLNSVVINKNIFAINNKLKQSYLLSKMSTVTADEDDFESKNLSFFMNDLKLLEDNYWRQIFTLIGSVIMTVGTLAYALYSNVYITLIFLFFMAIPTYAPKLFSKPIQMKTERWSKSNQTLSAIVKDLLHGALLLRRYHATNGFSKQLQNSISKMEFSNAELKNEISLSNNVIGFLFYVFSYLPIGLGIYFTIVGRITLAQFVAIQYSSSWILNGFNQIISGWNTINSTKEIQGKIKSLPEVTKFSQEQTEPVKALSAEQVGFNYDQKSIFQHVSFDLLPGQKMLIGGKSGVGKSTLFRMILGELKPVAGKLLLNSQEYSRKQAYDVFGIVGQTPIIFENSLKDNISLGDEQADDKKVIKALKQAGLEEFANEKALNMIISENGHNLSGGQLKRIEIARALYFDRQILLIDEGTASLDPITAEEIHRSILTNKQLTVIEIDHHIPTDIKPLYNRVYELTAQGLVKTNQTA